jgi:hypothetical protein
MSRCTGKRSAVGRPTNEDRRRVQAENSPGPKMGVVRPDTLCLFCMADQIAVTGRGVPMQRSSQVRALRMSVCMGRIRAGAPHASAQVTTTAQFAQCLPLVDAWERDGQMCVLKAAVRSAMEVAGAERREGHSGPVPICLFQSSVPRGVQKELRGVQDAEGRCVGQVWQVAYEGHALAAGPGDTVSIAPPECEDGRRPEGDVCRAREVPGLWGHSCENQGRLWEVVTMSKVVRFGQCCRAWSLTDAYPWP